MIGTVHNMSSWRRHRDRRDYQPAFPAFRGHHRDLRHNGVLLDAGTRGERLQIMLTPEELIFIDDFRFQYRMPSRAAAVREILTRGLSALGFAVPLQNLHSSEFGVTDDRQQDT
jgi:hypothetical protein